MSRTLHTSGYVGGKLVLQSIGFKAFKDKLPSDNQAQVFYAQVSEEALDSLIHTGKYLSLIHI